MKKKYPKSGPDIHARRKMEAQYANDAVLRSKTFLDACERAEVKPTRRQARKWKKGFGAARKRQNG